MRNALFPHMEWAKAHSRDPLPVELGFSGARAPKGPAFREHGSGNPELQARIARRYGVPDTHVYLVGGTSLANFVTIAAFCDAGDAVAVETPRYAPLAEIPRGLGATVLDMPRLDAALGPVPEGASLAIVSTPHNPTGRLLAREEWAHLSGFADTGGVVLVDEVYRDLQARPPAVAASRHPRFLTTGSFTKAYGLGALRLGWVLGAPDLLDRVRRTDNLVSVQVSTPSMLALKRVWPRLGELRRRAVAPVKANLAALKRSRLPFVKPEAGLTALVRVGDGDAAATALHSRGIGVAPGSFFGAPDHVRIFLGADRRSFAKGIAALRAYCGL
ncbi:MAG TPA: pyridoxal phosphate-dependent aminotransferase [Planctomycetota bacterium]|nr:pyridoxal phosphate-dependent aminotransferase [Planctomycetota bacterium]